MRKLRIKRGFTLPEMLIAVILLGLVSVMASVMTSAVLSTTTSMKEVAQAEILGSEALDNVQSQLRLAQNIRVDSDNKITFDKDSDNTDYVFDLEDGKIVLMHEGKSEELFAGVSYGNLKITNLTFSCDVKKSTEVTDSDGNKTQKVTDGTITVSIVVSYGESEYYSGKVSVNPLNGFSVVVAA